jgi:gliding motility-associated-like protein
MNEGQTWTSQDTRTAQDLNGLYFSDVNTGWTVGNQGIIRHTTDSGNTWQQQYSPQRTNWYDIAFSDTGTGLIVGACGSVLRTTDNGAVWERVVSGSNNDLRSVHFVNSTVALLVGSGGILLRSTDAGLNWLAVTGGGGADLHALASYEDVAWIGGDGAIYKSIDAGQTWEVQSLTGNFESIAATGTDHAYFVGSGGEIQETRDGGLTFTDISLPAVTDDLHDVMFPDSTIGFVVGDNGTLLQINYFSVEAESIAPICAGEPLNLSGTHDGTGATYDWINPQNSSVSMQQNPSLSATTTAMSGLYTFEVTIDGCTETDTTSVLINPSPTASVSGDIILCTGESTELNASGGDSYLWEDGSIDAVRTVSPTTDTDYSVQVTNGFGCTNEEMVSVTVNELPTVTIEPAELSGIGDNDAVVCSGDLLTLTAMGGLSYEWSTTETNQSISFNPTVSESYSVLVTDANDCQNTQSISVTVNENPEVEIQGDLSFCAGSSTTLSTDNTFPMFQWSNTETTEEITVSNAGNYTVTVTDTNGCTAENTQAVTENPAPTAVINGDLILCIGESTTLSASGGNQYLWEDGTSIDTRTVSPTTNTDYTVEVDSGIGCTDTETVTVIVNPLPTISIDPTDLSGNNNNDAVVCDGDPLTLTATGGSTYNWSIGQTGASVTFTPTTTTTETVTVTDVNECTDTENIIITVNENPTVEIQGDLSFCTGESTVLSIDGAFPTLQWSNAEITNAITVLSGAEYTVTVTDAAGCIAIAQETVTENPLPVVEISGSASICPDEITTLNASSGFTNYNWSTGQQGVNSSLDITNSGIYQVTVTDLNDCINTDIFEVSSPLETIGVADAGENTELCTEGNFQLSANLPAGASGLWSTTAALDIEDIADPNSFIFDLSAGSYDLNWSLSTTECADFSQSNVTVSVAFAPLANDDSSMGAFGEELTGNVLDNDNFSGDVNLQIQSSPLPNGLTLVEENGIWTGEWIFVAPSSNETTAEFTYEICSVECPELCNIASFSAITPLEEGFVPEGFTPNRDGINDMFVIPELEDPTAFPDNKIIIFNRWGDIVFEQENYRNTWGGEYQGTGADLPAGTYYYTVWLDVGEGEVREGSVVIIR